MSDELDIASLTAEITAAFVSNNRVAPDELAGVVLNVHAALSGVGDAPAAPTEELPAKATAAQIRRSITPDKLISFIDGKGYSTLKRHLTANGMDIHAYRARYGLPADYPSVAPAYAHKRSEMAKALGLGQLGRAKAAAPAPAPMRKSGRRSAKG